MSSAARCPAEFGGIERPGDESRFDPAVIERKAEGIEWPSEAKVRMVMG